MTDEQNPNNAELRMEGALTAIGLLLRALIDSHPDPKAVAHAWREYSSGAVVSAHLGTSAGEASAISPDSLTLWVQTFDRAIAHALRLKGLE